MKVAVSIPDDVFEEVDRLAEQLGASRSALYTKALAEYVRAHNVDEVTEAINAVVQAVGEEVDPFVDAAADLLLRDLQW